MIRLRHLAKDTVIYGLTSAARSLVGLFLIPIYTRMFSPGDYGQIDTLTTVVALLSLVLSLGMDTAVGMYFYDSADDKDRASMVTVAITVRVLLSFAAAFLIALLAPAISWQLFQTYDAVTAVRIAVWSAPINALVGFLINLLRFGRHPARYSILTVTNLLLGVFLSILFVVGLRWGIQGAFAGPLLANVIILPVGLFMNKKSLTCHLSYGWLRKLLQVGLPLVPAAFGGWLIAYSNRYFLLYFASSTDVGLLAVGSKVSAPLVLFTTAFRIAWAPFAFSIQKQPNAKEVYAKTLTYFLTVAGSVAVLVSLFAREALLVFTTPEYVPGYVVAGPVAFQLIADASYYVVSIGLTISKKTKHLAYSVPTAAVGSVIFNLLLTPNLGFFGAALASMLSYTLSALLAYLLAQREYHVPYEAFKIVRLVALCIGVWGLGTLVSTDNLWIAIGIKVVLVGVFVAGLLLLRVIGWREVKLVLDWLRQSARSLKQQSARFFHKEFV